MSTRRAFIGLFLALCGCGATKPAAAPFIRTVADEPEAPVAVQKKSVLPPEGWMRIPGHEIPKFAEKHWEHVCAGFHSPGRGNIFVLAVQSGVDAVVMQEMARLLSNGVKLRRVSAATKSVRYLWSGGDHAEGYAGMFDVKALPNGNSVMVFGQWLFWAHADSVMAFAALADSEALLSELGAGAYYPDWKPDQP